MTPTSAVAAVCCGPWGIPAPQAASLRVETDRLLIRLACVCKDGGEVTSRTEGQWKSAAGQPGVTLTEADDGYRLQLAPGVVQAMLKRT